MFHMKHNESYFLFFKYVSRETYLLYYKKFKYGLSKKKNTKCFT